MVTVKYTRTGEADIRDSNFRGQVPRKGGGANFSGANAINVVTERLMLVISSEFIT